MTRLHPVILLLVLALAVPPSWCACAPGSDAIAASAGEAHHDNESHLRHSVEDPATADHCANCDDAAVAVLDRNPHTAVLTLDPTVLDFSRGAQIQNVFALSAHSAHPRSAPPLIPYTLRALNVLSLT